MLRKLPEVGGSGALRNLCRIHDKSWVRGLQKGSIVQEKEPPRGDLALSLCP